MSALLLARRFFAGAVTLVAALAVMAAAIPSAASATVTASTVTSPATGSQYYVDQSESTSTTTAFTAAGTVTGTGNIDIVCVTNVSGQSIVLASNVAPSGGSFSIAITEQQLFSKFVPVSHGPCALRAVPTGTNAQNDGPGVPTAFAGPIVAVSDDTISVSGTTPYDFVATQVGIGSATTGNFELESAAGCGVTWSWLTAGTGSLPASNGVFDCAGALFDSYEINGTTNYTPSEVTVDGNSAVLSDAIFQEPTLSGFQQPTFSDSFSQTGGLTLHDDEPVMQCVPGCVGTTHPTSLAPSGVELDRTWQTTANGLIAYQTDVFRSTDGKAHSVTALEDDDFNRDSTNGTTVDFPGTSGFLSYAPGNTIAPVSGPGAIYAKPSATTPDAGDSTYQWAQGAIVYARAPDAAMAVTYWAPLHYPEFYLPYNLSIPASGGSVLRFAYVQDFALSDVKTLAQQALASFNPALTISSPASGAMLAKTQTKVTGTATDASGVKTLTVDGKTVPVNSTGQFSAAVTLPVGASTITAVATDNDALTTTTTLNVTVAKQKTQSVGTKVKRAGHHKYKITGKLKLPSGVTAKQGCSGKLTLTARRGKKKLGSGSARVGKSCAWSDRFKAKGVKGHGKFKLTVAFKGNAWIKPYTAKAVSVHY